MLVLESCCSFAPVKGSHSHQLSPALILIGAPNTRVAPSAAPTCRPDWLGTQNKLLEGFLAVGHRHHSPLFLSPLFLSTSLNLTCLLARCIRNCLPKSVLNSNGQLQYCCMCPALRGTLVRFVCGVGCIPLSMMERFMLVAGTLE